MFTLTTVVDSIRIPPSAFHLSTKQSITNEISSRYPNKVIMDVGLVITLYEILNISSGTFIAGDGGAHYEVLFRLLVFRPFVGECLQGFINNSTKEGIQLTLGFFQDVFIPGHQMLHPSHFDQEKKMWVWAPKYDDNDDIGDDGEAEEEPSAYEFEIGSEVRFKVRAIHFTKVTETTKGVQATCSTTSKTSIGSGSAIEGRIRSMSITNNSENVKEDDEDNPSLNRVRSRSNSLDLTGADRAMWPASMRIVGSFCEDGLGLTSWWGAGEEEEEAEDEGGEEEQNEENGVAIKQEL